MTAADLQVTVTLKMHASFVLVLVSGPHQQQWS